MAAKKKTKSSLKPKKQKAPTRARPVEADEADLFGARGGLPQVVLSMPSVDRSSAKKSTTRELTWAEFDRDVHVLARAAARKLKPTAVVGLAHGGVFVGGAVASALKAEFFPVRITRRSRDTRKTTFHEELPKELAGQRVLIVDDVAGSGDSLELAVRMARSIGAKALGTAAIVRRPEGFEPDFFAHSTSEFFVFPWDYQDVAVDARFDPDTAGA